MKRGFLGAGCCALLIIAAAIPASAQLAAPNAAGVSLGAVYYTVPDVDTHRKIWVDIFGAKPVMVGKTEMLKLPGVFIVLTKGEPAAGNALINHLGIWAKDLDPTRAKLTAAGVQTAPKAQFVDLPNALRLEFIDDPAGPDAPAAHHIHYFVASQEAGLTARAWYVKTFGATENARRNGGVPSALLTTPEKWISVDFTAAGGGGRGGRGGGRGGRGGAPAGADAGGGAPAPAPPAAAPAAAPAGPAPNKGTILDRFALEVKGLDAFVKKIESEGVKVTRPVSTNADGLKTAMIVDSLGNEVELTEGLAGK